MITEKIKISSHQLYSMILIFTLGTNIMSLNAGIAGLAKQDAWISVIIASAVGFGFVWMYSFLATLYPGKTFVEMTMCAFGKWAGWILSAVFVLFVGFLDVSQDIYFVGNFISVEYMPETPKYALYLLMTIGIVIGLFYGLETIARSAEIFIYVVVALVIITLLFNTPNIKIVNLLPILENGIAPVLKGSLLLTSYLTWPLIIFTMIYPSCMDNSNNIKTPMLSGYLVGAVISFLCTLVTILVLGSSVTSKAQFSTYLLAQEISIGIITRIEGILSGAWIVTQFIRSTLFFYAGLIGFTQLFGFKNYKQFILPFGLIILVYAGVVYPNVAYQSKWDSTTWVLFIGTYSFILPVLLIIIALIKKSINKVKSYVESIPGKV